MKIALYVVMCVAVMSLGTSFGLPVSIKWLLSAALLVLLFFSIKNKKK